MPQTSILMCVRNGQNYLAEAIESVLCQTDQDFEFIVVDDGSSDGTADILKRYRQTVSVVSVAASEGIGLARNRGVAASSGSLVVFFDHDDLLLPDSIAVRRELLERSPEAEAAEGLADEFIAEGFEQALADEGVSPRSGVAGSLAALMVRRSAFDRIGPFEDLPSGAGINWLMRARSNRLAVVKTDRVLFRRRLHGSNDSRRVAINDRLRFEAIRRLRGSRGVGGSPSSSSG
ncbi:MAG: glycosyltransferase family A protein [Acidimicrobiales bacterium]